MLKLGRTVLCALAFAIPLAAASPASATTRCIDVEWSEQEQAGIDEYIEQYPVWEDRGSPASDVVGPLIAARVQDCLSDEGGEQVFLLSFLYEKARADEVIFRSTSPISQPILAEYERLGVESEWAQPYRSLIGGLVVPILTMLGIDEGKLAQFDANLEPSQDDIKLLGDMAFEAGVPVSQTNARFLGGFGASIEFQRMVRILLSE